MDTRGAPKDRFCFLSKFLFGTCLLLAVLGSVVYVTHLVLAITYSKLNRDAPRHQVPPFWEHRRIHTELENDGVEFPSHGNTSVDVQKSRADAPNHQVSAVDANSAELNHQLGNTTQKSFMQTRSMKSANQPPASEVQHTPKGADNGPQGAEALNEQASQHPKIHAGHGHMGK